MKTRLTFCFLISALLVSVSCGTKPPEELILGSWEAVMGNETTIVEIRSDGTVQAEDEDIQRWSIEEDGDDLIFRITDFEDGSPEAELILVFDGKDHVTLSDESGVRMTMERTE